MLMTSTNGRKGADWTVAAARARRPLRDPTGDSRRSRRQRARRAVRRASDGWCCTNTRSSASLVCSVIYRPPGPAACRDQFAGDRPGLVRCQKYRDERDLRSVHHAADGIAARRVRSEVLPLRRFRGYAQLGGAGGEQAWRALGTGRAGMDAIDRDPMAAQLNCQRLSCAPGRHCGRRR